ncbi:MAG: UMP kinase, partial [Clostridia bacterium]|nr:UMP kinase [Clostridia bacterium]
GGNIWRGRSSGDMDRSIADHMGMLATMINSLCLHDALAKQGIDSRILTPLEMPAFGELFTGEKAIRYLEEGRIVIFGCGSGHPYFSTDTPAVLRTREIKADVLMMAKAIDGVYTADPGKDPTAVRLDKISYTEILNKNLTVIDMTAAALARDLKITSYLFGLDHSDNIRKVIYGEKMGTIVKE